MTPPRLASIDLGTNTVRLLVVEVGATGQWRVIDQDQLITRLGEGLAARGRLGETPMARTGAVVAEYIDRALRAGASETHIIATSAVREAANGREFAAALQRTTGRPVQVVSGQDEARLTIRGILKGLRSSAGPVLAFDIGGGGTGVVLARHGPVGGAGRPKLGGVPPAARPPFPDPPGPGGHPPEEG